MTARRALVCVVACVVLAASPAASAKGPASTIVNGDVLYTLNWQHETSLAERSRHGPDVRYLRVSGWWSFPVANGRARGLSRDGGTLVLVQRSSPALAQRTESRFAVIDVRRFRVSRVLRLPGRLEFGAISADGRRLTLVERGRAGTRTRVHVLGFAR